MNPDKPELRKQLLQERQNLPDRLERMTRLQHVLRAFLIGRSDLSIGAYWPIKAEFDALPALYRWQEDALLAQDQASQPHFSDSNHHKSAVKPAQTATEFVANILSAAQNDSIQNLPAGPISSPRKIGLPVIDKEHKRLTFHAWWPGCPMQEDAYNIPKPQGTEILQPSLLLVPCLGYTDGGYRLGYGGGFYDRTLAAISPKPFTVGLAFANAYAPDWQPEAHDVPLDAILTDHGQMWG